MKRPYFKLTDEVKDKIASDLYNGFKANFEGARISFNDIREVIEYAGEHSNGYELAKELESNRCCDIDVLIVEELDSVSYCIREEKSKMLEEWVKENNIKPLLGKGDKVKFREKEYFINGFFEDKALYKVGEKLESQSNYLVPYEDIEEEK